ncbi:MAG TPA: hypothetical protein PKN48_10540 [Bacteroidales bacterium]|nr:hypothetical protein [Bacteroidales bacterium]
MKKITLIFPKKPRTKKSVALGGRKQILMILPVMMFMLFSMNIMAQNAIELGPALNSLKITANQQYNVINSLIYDVQPTVYVQNGMVQSFGNGPAKRVEVSTNSFDNLYETNPVFSDVEIITVKINNKNDLKMPGLNIQDLSHFTNLKYILYLCSINCDPVSINKMFTPEIHDGITIFYQISIPN